MRIVLIPGGIWEPAMTAARFWDRSGVRAELARRGHEVVLIDRVERPTRWVDELPPLRAALTEPAVLWAGSNGCSVAALLAEAEPERVPALVLGWPATAGDTAVDQPLRDRLIREGASVTAATTLLAGSTLRGVDDAALAALPMPVAVVPSRPANPVHQQRTVDRLIELGAGRLIGTPEPPRPDFPPFLDAVVDAVASLARTAAG